MLNFNARSKIQIWTCIRLEGWAGASGQLFLDTEYRMCIMEVHIMVVMYGERVRKSIVYVSDLQLAGRLGRIRRGRQLVRGDEIRSFMLISKAEREIYIWTCE